MPDTFWDTPPIVLNPRHPARATVLWLHGLGADGEDFVGVAESLQLADDLSVRHILPHAPRRPVTVNQGLMMRAWYDIALDGPRWVPNDDDLRQSVQAVNLLIDQEIAQGISPEKIFIAGFSQGGAVALTAGTRYASPLGGILALSTYLPLPHELLPPPQSNPRNPDIFMGHGVSDPVIPYARGEASRQSLMNQGYAVEWHSYPMAHSVCLDEIHDMAQWFGARLSK
ncbi:MAG: carboxylesterase [Ferrovum sp.]|nr:carboxylesterase [Ferrovum sp.]NDU87716.1 carboxylesterase [Ferrovum sp.]